MRSLLRGTPDRGSIQLPLFPLRTVLFPGGLLPLRIFEQRYIELTKACVRDGSPFGVCLLTRGAEVAGAATDPPAFATVGTLATIDEWDMPELGIFHVRTAGGARFEVLSHTMRPDGLVVADIVPIPAEPVVALTAVHAPLVQLLEVLATRIGPRDFPAARAFDDASWVGYRLAELLPLPLSIKQRMLEVNDGNVRLDVLQRFLAQQGVL
jgi:Lon protease-like protein